LKLLVGLGNPGPEYARTRHNVGFLVADEVARLAGSGFTLRKFGAEIAEAAAGGEKFWIVKPQTYMNHSGEAVGAAMRFWKLDLADLVVVHDDLELDAFRVQVKVGGGHGGHNGLRSVNAHVGGPDYARVRVGVGRPPPQVDPADWVLGRFPRAEDREVAEVVERGAEAARAVVVDGAVKAMNEFNRRRSPAG
jgi:PTH1 family peptidyl-tRNA hydrolase